MEEIRFSIIVPVFNINEPYLRASLSSLLNIDYKNYEIIIIDDGSDVKTKKIIDEYSDNKKTKIIHQKNSGQLVARNNGVKVSSGDYVIFFDGDDLYNKNNLNVFNEILNEYKYDVILHDNVRFDESKQNIFNGKFFDKEGPVEKTTIIEKLVKLQIGSVCIKCFKKEILEGIDIDSCSVRKGEDLMHFTKIALKANSFYYTDRAIYYYRINNESREYYQIDNTDNLNYLVSLYEDIFVKNDDYSFAINEFKLHAVNDVIYNAFFTCRGSASKESIKEILNKLSKHKIISIIDSIAGKLPFTNNLIYGFVKNENYYVINVFAKIFSIIKK